MPGEALFDTNVLIYAFTDDPRSSRAEALLAAGGLVSVQNLNEFANVARRKLGWSWDKIDDALDLVSRLTGPPLPLTLEVHRRALAIARDSQLSLYDALVVASASGAGCETLYSEDMQDSQTLAGLTIRNPFKE